jgi:hypothetical protein
MKYFHVGSVFVVVSSIWIMLTAYGCKSTTIKISIPVASLKKATLDTGKSLTLLQLLRTYPTQMDCKDGKRYANLYIGVKFTDGDTVCVFEECTKVSPFALDTRFHYAGVLEKSNTIDEWPDVFTVFVPSNFKFPKNSKCFFTTKLAYLTEY